MIPEIWKQPDAIAWSQLLLDSYRKYLGRELIERNGKPTDEAKVLFFSPVVVASHGTEPDPILNYGNQIALNLWEMTWKEFTQTPSRLTAEPIHQDERAKMLKQAAERGYNDEYQGVRITKSGRRFRIENAIIWNLVDNQNHYRGQAATFAKWHFITVQNRSV